MSYLKKRTNWTTKQITVNGVDVNTSVVFTKTPVLDKVTISVSAEKTGNGPDMVLRATGGGTKTIGSECKISTTCQSYIDTDGVIHNPIFHGWWKEGICVSTSEYYTFIVTSSESYAARWSWN